MRRYPIYLNYDMDSKPVGWVEFDGPLELAEVREGAIVPYLHRDNSKPDAIYDVTAFGLVPRITVDTSPRKVS
jgi:hypothetical protein